MRQANRDGVLLHWRGLGVVAAHGVGCQRRWQVGILKAGDRTGNLVSCGLDLNAVEQNMVTSSTMCFTSAISRFHPAVRTHRDVFIGVEIYAGILVREQRVYLLFASLILHKNRKFKD